MKRADVVAPTCEYVPMSVPFDPNSINVAEVAQTLRDNLANLVVRDQSFASSLLGQLDRKGLSNSQLYWLNKLSEKATATPEPEREKTKVGDLKGIMALFDKAQQHLKFPAIVLAVKQLDDFGATGVYNEYRLSVAGDRARVPGSINVTGYSVTTGEDKAWFGRILVTGEFEASPREATPKNLIPGLARFANDPVNVAKESGMLTGKCCFCNLPLKDERSTAVGYGPICAKHYDLDWGK
jgi:hypothetical protein